MIKYDIDNNTSHNQDNLGKMFVYQIPVNIDRIPMNIVTSTFTKDFYVDSPKKVNTTIQLVKNNTYIIPCKECLNSERSDVLIISLVKLDPYGYGYGYKLEINVTVTCTGEGHPLGEYILRVEIRNN